MARLGYNDDGYPVTLPIKDAREAIAELRMIFDMQGYDESQGDLWLNLPLSRVISYLYDQLPEYQS